MTVLRRVFTATIVEVEGDPCEHSFDSALIYDTEQPYTAGLLFTEGDQITAWVFARDLLGAAIDGQDRGIADVQVGTDGDRVVVRLCSPSGVAFVQIGRDAVMQFLVDSYALVAPGLESEHLDIDLELAALLRQGYTGRRRAPDDAPLPDPWRGPWPDGGGGRG